MKLRPSDFNFYYEFTVYFDECDPAGIVHNSNYMKYMERCRTEYVHNLGYKYTKESLGEEYYIVVTENWVNYLYPAKGEDKLRCYGRIRDIKKFSYRFEYLLERVGDGKLIAQAYTIVCKMDENYSKVKKLSPEIIEKITNFEDKCGEENERCLEKNLSF